MLEICIFLFVAIKIHLIKVRLCSKIYMLKTIILSVKEQRMPESLYYLWENLLFDLSENIPS